MQWVIVNTFIGEKTFIVSANFFSNLLFFAILTQLKIFRLFPSLRTNCAGNLKNRRCGEIMMLFYTQLILFLSFLFYCCSYLYFYPRAENMTNNSEPTNDSFSAREV